MEYWLGANTGCSECTGELRVGCELIWVCGRGICVLMSQVAYDRDVARDIVETLPAQMKDLNFFEETPNEWDDHIINWTTE